MKKFEGEPERWLDVDWNEREGTLYPVRLRMTVIDKPAVLAGISTTISKLESNISQISTASKGGGFTGILLEVEVKNTDHLNNIMSALKSLPFVVSLDKEYRK